MHYISCMLSIYIYIYTHIHIYIYARCDLVSILICIGNTPTLHEGMYTSMHTSIVFHDNMKMARNEGRGRGNLS